MPDWFCQHLSEPTDLSLVDCHIAGANFYIFKKWELCIQRNNIFIGRPSLSAAYSQSNAAADSEFEVSFTLYTAGCDLLGEYFGSDMNHFEKVFQNKSKKRVESDVSFFMPIRTMTSGKCNHRQLSGDT